MLEPIKGDFRPTSELSDIKDSSRYSREELLKYNGEDMMVLSQPKEGITSEGKVLVYARVRYYDEVTSTIKVGYAMEVVE
jgi:hypothetical protein